MPASTFNESQRLGSRPASLGSKLQRTLEVLLVLVIFIIGFGGGYHAGRRSHLVEITGIAPHGEDSMAALVDEINPPGGYPLPATFGDVGPRVVAAGGIDLDAFKALYAQAGRPLSDREFAILTTGSSEQIVIDRENAQFLLNFFWGLGLTNANPLLTEGPLMQYDRGEVGNFASTGGWTLSTKPVTELYASVQIVPLTAEQQARLLEVASAVYRPCCDNATHFPDCNHGMAMLGLLELMASQNASVNEMFEAAKYVNAFWFPQQMLEAAIYFRATQDMTFTNADARQVVGQAAFSGSGFRSMHGWLAGNGLLEEAPSAGGSCGVQ